MSAASSDSLKAGWGSADITPKRTSELYGQYYRRVAQGVRDPLSVTSLALEQPSAGKGPVQVIFASLDQAMVDRGLQEAVRERLKREIPDFDSTLLVMNATHTHNAPAGYDSLEWWEHDPALLSNTEYHAVLVDAAVTAAVQAWKGRSVSQIGSAYGLASVGHCRRPMYRDGSSEMYGATDRPDFVGMEGGQDDTIGVIGVWDSLGKLSGIVVNVVCPSQVMEATYVVTADMFGEMRRLLKERLGKGVSVLCHVGAAGDQAPRDLTHPHRKGPTYWDEAGLVALGKRLADAVIQALPAAEAARTGPAVFRHEVCAPRLPLRMVSPAEYARAVSELAALRALEPPAGSADTSYARFVSKTQERERLPVPGPYDDKNNDFVLIRNLEAVVKRFELQRRSPDSAPEIHVLRLGDTAMSTSPFELYLDYGLRIRARSPAALTLHTQLACDTLGYLPTARAVAAGGYGALVANGLIGPEGGQILVECILESTRRLFGA